MYTPNKDILKQNVTIKNFLFKYTQDTLICGFGLFEVHIYHGPQDIYI